MKYKYKIKSWRNDLGEVNYEPYRKRWFGLYTSLHYGVGNLDYAERMIRYDVENMNRPIPKTIYYDVEINGAAIKINEREIK
mgnify:FL=1|tara:strand:+ start:530 stop:775 length:246 start_codon:yes stop_codon:yes gene_type:complete